MADNPYQGSVEFGEGHSPSYLDGVFNKTLQHGNKGTRLLFVEESNRGSNLDVECAFFFSHAPIRIVESKCSLGQEMCFRREITPHQRKSFFPFPFLFGYILSHPLLPLCCGGSVQDKSQARDIPPTLQMLRVLSYL